jgi:hypothetical protein
MRSGKRREGRGWLATAAVGVGLGAALLAGTIGMARGDGRREPPAEAIAACDGRAAGDACSVTIGDRTIDGTCRSGRDGKGPLACRPARPHAPPPEAIAACEGRAAGDACSVSIGDRTIDGTCRARPDGAGPLACMPAHRDRPQR